MAGGALNPERWQEISPHLDEALSLSEEDRADWLAAFRAQRPELADFLEKLLQEHRALADEHFLESETQKLTNEPSLTGETLGAYKLICHIGEGCFGRCDRANNCSCCGRLAAPTSARFAAASLPAAAGLYNAWRRSPPRSPRIAVTCCPNSLRDEVHTHTTLCLTALFCCVFFGRFLVAPTAGAG